MNNGIPPIVHSLYEESDDEDFSTINHTSMSLEPIVNVYVSGTFENPDAHGIRFITVGESSHNYMAPTLDDYPSRSM